MAHEVDMTAGRPFDKLFVFALPVVAGSILQQMYNMADAMIAGRFLGSDALAAVANCSYVTFLVTILFLGVGNGAGIVISQFYGAGEIAKVKRAANTMFVFLFFAAVLCTAVGFTMSGKILWLLDTPPYLQAASEKYLRITFSGALFSLGYTILSTMLNGIGNSKIPLVFLALSSVVNIILDIVFITCLAMDVEGLALATVISQFTALFACCVYLNATKQVIQIRLSEITFDRRLFMTICRLGIPTGIQNSLMIVSMMVLQKEVNHFGVDVIAGRSIAGKLESVMMLPFTGISTAIMTYVGQNIGARKESRLAGGLKCSFVMVLATSSIFFILYHIFGRLVLSSFTSEPHTLHEADICLSIIAPSFVFYGMASAWQSFFRGAGDTIFPLFVTILTQFAYRIVMIPVFRCIDPSPSGIWYLYVSSWILMFLLDFAYYKTNIWRKYYKYIY